MLFKSFQDLKLPEPEHKPSLPAPRATPAPQVNKVTAGEVIRKPINRQAALLIRRIQCWTAQPLPEAPKFVDLKECDRLKAELKSERNAHAATRDELGYARARIKALREVVSIQAQQIDDLKNVNRAQADTIRQLEDLKL